MWVKVDEDGRIAATTPYEEYSDEEMFEYEFPEDFVISDQDDYRIVDNELIFDPIPDENPQPENSAEELKQMKALSRMLVTTMTFTDRQAAEVSLLFPDWTVGEKYKMANICRYEDHLYRALQDSTAQAHFPPDTSTSLWKLIPEPDENGIFPWVQPLGSTDAYKKGDIVSYEGKYWRSTIDANTWEPGTGSLWEEVTDIA